MNPEEWIYTGEGGKHVVFRYTGDNDRRWKGKLIRISKKCHDDNAMAAEAAAIRHRGLCDRLAPYVDASEAVEIDRDNVRKLFRKTKESGVIPSHRQKDWTESALAWLFQNFNDDNNNTQQQPHIIVGFVLQDYRLSHNGTDPHFWSIEIKPKAGYTAISPLVRRAEKLRQSRFTLTHDEQHSLYDPLDLFSDDADRIRWALECLATNPRNNLKVWMTSSEGSTTSAKTTTRTWIPIATAILQHEHQFLSQLVSLQKLDILDADGAVLVYEHLVRSCRDDDPAAAAERLLDAPTPFALRSTVVAPHSLLEQCPLVPPSSCPVLVELCETIDAFQSEFSSSSQQQQAPDKADTLQRYRSLALSIVERLSVPECTYLLQTWLLSLSMSDVSCFVRFWPAAVDCDPPPCCCQDRDHPGRFTVQEQAWEYEIKLIDLDPKPATKLRTRKRKEDALEQKIINNNS